MVSCLRLKGRLFLRNFNEWTLFLGELFQVVMTLTGIFCLVAHKTSLSLLPFILLSLLFALNSPNTGEVYLVGTLLLGGT